MTKKLKTFVSIVYFVFFYIPSPRSLCSQR
jgi:hypothetical protein